VHQPGRDPAGLYLNIWAPSKGLEERPVLLFVHGGSFVMGSGAEYNSSLLAAKHNVVVVTVNYRLNDLGWAQVVDGLANFGLQDQRSAMRWVKANIGGFGGDASHILLFGESAGAISVALHLLAPASCAERSSDRLFHAALMESGAALAKPSANATALATKYVTLAGCAFENASEQLSCLRRAPLARLWNASVYATTGPPQPWEHHGWGATVDGVEIVKDPVALLSEGALCRMPLLAGVNTNEGSSFLLPYAARPLSLGGFSTLVSRILHNANPTAGPAVNISDVLTLYQPSAVADNAPLAADLLADIVFKCGTRHLARAMSSTSATATTATTASVYLYRFDQRARDDPSPTSWGVSHGSEVPFVFDNGSWVGDPAPSSFTTYEEWLATAIGGAWASFAAQGLPSASPNGSWAPYTNATDLEAVLAVPQAVDITPAFPLRMQPNARATFCSFWEQNGIV